MFLTDFLFGNKFYAHSASIDNDRLVLSYDMLCVNHTMYIQREAITGTHVGFESHIFEFLVGIFLVLAGLLDNNSNGEGLTVFIIGTLIAVYAMYEMRKKLIIRTADAIYEINSCCVDVPWVVRWYLRKQLLSSQEMV